MNEAHELAEKIEQAAHGAGHEAAGHGGGGISRKAGITMAILGVMLALCAALVGGARTELIATMVEQSNTFQKYQAQRMKHRMMLTQLAALHALSPSRKELKKFQDQLATVHPAGGKAESEDAVEMKTSFDLAMTAFVKIVEPRAEELLRLVAMTRHYAEQTEAAAKWAESYAEAVEAYSGSAEHFELGQLSAEIGIVIASVALLLANRKAWYLSLLFGAVCATTLSWTYVTTRARAGHAEEEIASTHAAYDKLRKGGGAEEDDDAILNALEKRIQETTTPADHH